MQLFIDLEKELSRVELLGTSKIETLVQNLPPISLYAIGGFPVKWNGTRYTILGRSADPAVMREEIQSALGLSGMLTYMNKSGLSTSMMGAKCKELGHLWGFNWITISLLFVNKNLAVEKSFLRDSNFYESWSIDNSKIFGMNGSIKSFMKFVSNKDDKSFDPATRKVMTEIDSQFNFLWT